MFLWLEAGLYGGRMNLLQATFLYWGGRNSLRAATKQKYTVCLVKLRSTLNGNA